MKPVDALWTLDELCVRVAEALEGEGAADGRIRETPDRRTIRYYTTLGLIDRPAELRGRTAYYGRKHLLQLLAIKRLQTRGLTLAEIQQHLLGLTEAELLPLAQLPRDSEILGSSAEPQAETTEPDREEAFWRAGPAPVSLEAEVNSSESPSLENNLLQGVHLDEQVILLLGTARPLREEDVAAIRAAAAPLLNLLQLRGLRP